MWTAAAIAAFAWSSNTHTNIPLSTHHINAHHRHPNPRKCSSNSKSAIYALPPNPKEPPTPITTTIPSSSSANEIPRPKSKSKPRRGVLKGVPSTPGWRSGQLDMLTDWAVSDEANRPVLCEYESDALWLWTRWRGTVLSIVIKDVIVLMALGVLVDFGAHSLSSSVPSWPLFAVPPADDPLIMQLQGLNSLWEYQLTLCTFILTFFTSQSYSYWRSVYFTTRAIQGRINDICLLITIGAGRASANKKGEELTAGTNEECSIKNSTESQEEVNGGVNGAAGNDGSVATGYCDRGAEDLVMKCARLIKLSHTFFWAATPTCSNGVGDGGVGDDGAVDDDDIPPELRREDTIGPVLLSPQGLIALERVGELTREEIRALVNSGLPPSQYGYVLLEWVGLHAMNGLEAGTLRGGPGFEENLLKQICSLRAEYFSIGDLTSGRMPLAYVQLVQILVDSLVVLAPFALYPDLGSISVPLTGLLTIFYKGLLELSKSFLDPFGNEGHPGQNIRVDVLVSELNFGAGVRWVRAGQVLPPDPEPNQ